MPTLIIQRFPMPSISIYVILSISVLLLSILWANNSLIDEQEILISNKSVIEESENSQKNVLPDSSDKVVESERKSSEDAPKTMGKEVTEFWKYPNTDDSSEASVTFSVKKSTHNSGDEPFVGTEIAKAIISGKYSFAYGVFNLMLEEPLCLILVVNATYCVLALVMKIIQNFVFGNLRPIERQHMKDKFWNFVFYKFIFIFGVMNVQSLNEVLVWVSWFTMIAFLLLLTKLSKDRFDFLSFSPNTPIYFHWKVVGLLVFILLSCVLLAISCITSTFPFAAASSANQDIHSVTFMLAECVIISTKAAHVLLRYSIHMYDVRHEELWERKATLVYYTDLIMELISLLINFIHHIHMLFSGNIWLSMASLVICMQLRYIFSEIRKRILKHKNYRRVVANMEAQFPAASQEELTTHEDRCAVCWDQMESARKLPCGHFFHSACLRSWLEQDTTCPTCRKQLDIRSNTQNDVNIIPNADTDDEGNPVRGIVPPAAPVGVLNPRPGVRPRRNLWHFDGSRIASWLPIFSFELRHSPHGAQAMVTTRTRQNQLRQDVSTSQLDAMVREVQEIFPQIPARVIANDIRVSGSVEATTDNILEGNIAIPPDQIIPEPSSRSPHVHSEFQVPSPPNPISESTLRRRNLPSSSISDPTSNRLHTNVPSSSTASASAIPSTAADEVAPGPSQGASAIGGHFSKAPHERELVLKNRRDMLLRQARLRYLTSKKQLSSSNEATEQESCSSKITSQNIPLPSDIASTSSQAVTTSSANLYEDSSTDGSTSEESLD